MKLKIRMFLIPLISILALAIVFSIWQYVLTIYEVKVEVKPDYLSPDGKSIAIIKTIPVNALGFQAPFRKSPAHIEIIEGKELISLIQVNEADGEFKLQARNEKGKVSLQIKPKFSLMPSLVEIPILDSIPISK